MIRKGIGIIIGLAFVVTVSMAQGFDVGGFTGYTSYIGDYTLQEMDRDKMTESDHYGYGIKYGYGYFFSFAFQRYYSKFSGTTENLSSSYQSQFEKDNFTTTLDGLSISVEFNILKFDPISPGYSFSPYLGLGINIFQYEPMTYENNEMVHMLGAGSGALEHEKSSGFSTPFRFGLKSELYKYFYLDAGAGLEITGIDQLDGFAHGNSVDYLVNAYLGLYFRIPPYKPNKNQVICPTAY